MKSQFRTYKSTNFKWRGLTMTSTAAARIRDLTNRQPDALGLRLGVKQAGCAGFSYVLNVISKSNKEDLLFEKDGAKLFVSLQVMSFIDGTEIDYVHEGLNQLFKFYNPQVRSECGCGESFEV